MYTQAQLRKRLKSYKKKNRYSFKALALEINDVSESWLQKFVKGVYKSPDYDNMRAVHKYLMRMDK